MSRSIPKISSIIDALVDSGGTLEQVRAVIAAAEAAQEAHEERTRADAEAEIERKRALKRVGNAERQRKLRASRSSQRDGALRDVTERDDALPGCDQGCEGARAIEDNLPLLSQEKETPKGVSKKKGSRSRQTFIAEDAQPEAADRLTATNAGMDQPTFRHEWALFRGWHIANGKGSLNWRQSWRNWVLNWVGKGCKLVGGGYAKARLAEMSRDTSDPRIDFGGGISAPLSTVRQRLEQGKWYPDWRGKPGESNCVIPRELWADLLPKKPRMEHPTLEVFH